MRQFTLGRAAVCALVIALAGCGETTVHDSAASSVVISAAGGTIADSYVALSSSAYTVSASAGAAVLTVNRTGTPTGEIDVNFTTVDGSAVAGSDYQGTSGSLTWVDGDQTPKSIEVPIASSDSGKSFTVELTAVSGNGAFGSPTQATVTVSSAVSGASSLSASPSGSMDPPLTQLVDASGDVWTVSGGVVSLNGAIQPITQHVILLLYYQGVMYQENSDCLWWDWTGGAWVNASQPAIAGIPGCTGKTGGSTATSGTGTGSSGASSTPAASASGTMIPSAAKLVDGAGNTWTVSGGVISLNGTVQSATHKVIVLLYYQGVIYQENSDCLWWSWTGGTWVATSRPAAGGVPACSAVVTSAGGTTTTTVTSSGSGSGSGSNANGPVPAAAAAVNYNTLTFGPAVTLGSNWFFSNFYGTGDQPAGAASQNADGTLFISGLENNRSGSTVSTARHVNTRLNWTGTAFGGGAYFEAVLSFTGQGKGPYLNGGPAFWALDIEHTSQGPYQVSWPGMPKDAAGNPYDDFFEVDFMEYDAGPYAFQNGIGNWYGYPPTKSTSNPYSGGGGTGAVKVATTTNFAQFHKYGCLWVPATPSNQGYLKFYFDDVQTGETFYWNYDNPANPFPPPPVNNSTAMSGMDQRHMFLILGTGTSQPMTVQSVSVWQASAANNLTE
jgi:hypothetical protein